MFSSILCPIDLSECSRHALNEAIRLAVELHSTVTVLHVVDPPDALLEKQEYVDYLAEQYKAPLSALMQRLHEQYPAVLTANACVLEGRTASTIVEFARTHGHQLIVIGTHGRTGVAHSLLGSVAERVIRTSSVPVLTIPPERTLV